MSECLCSHFMTRSEGLTSRDLSLFRLFLVKANDEQVGALKRLLELEVDNRKLFKQLSECGVL